MDGVNADRAARQLVSGVRAFGVGWVPLGAAGETMADPLPVEPAVSAEPAAGEAPAPVQAAGDKRSRLMALHERYEADAGNAARLIEGWNSVVFDAGDPDAKIMFVGEAPGADEDREGIPFVGRAGQLLEKMIVAMGLSRESVYIANVLKVRPPNNRDPSESEVSADAPYLHEEIEIIAPDALVALGRPAASFLLGEAVAIGKVRGSWHAYASPSGVEYPVMPTYHPAYLLRAYTDDNRRRVWSDLQAVMSRVGLA